MRNTFLSTLPLLVCSLACSGNSEPAGSSNGNSGPPILPGSEVVPAADNNESTSVDPLQANQAQADDSSTPAATSPSSEQQPDLSASDLNTPETSATSDVDSTQAEVAPETEAEQDPIPELVTRSAGCGQANPPIDGRSIGANGLQADYFVSLPNNYNPNETSPLVFGFHGRGQTHLQFKDQDASQIKTELGSRAIMVYVKSVAGNGWNAAEEVQPNVDIFEALYPQVLDDYCVNPSEVFAVGHSSGGFFSNILACRFPERFLGIGSVAGATQECSGQVPAIVVHGVRDAVVDFDRGQASRDGYLEVNGCSQTSQPTGIGPCIAYEGCLDGLPVQWCEHNEPTYQDTNHGWPSFASRALGEFLFDLL